MVNVILANLAVFLIIAAIVSFVIIYIVKEKRKGVKCIGCPSAQACASNNGKSEHTCSCSSHSNSESTTENCR